MGVSIAARAFVVLRTRMAFQDVSNTYLSCGVVHCSQSVCSVAHSHGFPGVVLCLHMAFQVSTQSRSSVVHSHGFPGLTHHHVSWPSPAEDEKLAQRLQREEYEAQKRHREMMDQPPAPHKVRPSSPST